MSGSSSEMIRTEMLKGYLKRLSEGEDMEAVRADFVEHFSDVDAVEIMRAEQELIQEGTPITEVQKLCDIHSALFHGTTGEGEIAKTAGPDLSKKHEKKAELANIKGHPLHTFTRENEALAVLLGRVRKKIDAGEHFIEELWKMKEVSAHYARKGDLLYPHLKVKYGVSGPSDVMWTVDDEIRDELADLLQTDDHHEGWLERVRAVLKRVDEMIYKEDNILFPNCAVYFTEDEWKGIYRDSKDYSGCFGVEPEIWEEAENGPNSAPQLYEMGIRMPGGSMTVEQLAALLNTIPMEITFIDADNINRFFNEGPKVFKRPGMALGRDVFSCHPPKIEVMVKQIIDDFRSGRKDSVPIWMEKGGRLMLVKYMAVRDRDGNYLGTVELVQDMEFAKEHFMGE